MFIRTGVKEQPDQWRRDDLGIVVVAIAADLVVVILVELGLGEGVEGCDGVSGEEVGG